MFKLFILYDLFFVDADIQQRHLKIVKSDTNKSCSNSPASGLSIKIKLSNIKEKSTSSPFHDKLVILLKRISKINCCFKGKTSKLTSFKLEKLITELVSNFTFH